MIWKSLIPSGFPGRLSVTGHLAVAAALALGACQAAPAEPITRNIDIVAHRGARGLLPENSLPGFAKALEIGVTAIELDVGLSRDRAVVVTHDQRLNPDLTRGPDGSFLSGEGAAVIQLTLAELQTYDVGRIKPSSKYRKRFRNQKGMDGVSMPTLEEVIALVRRAGNKSLRLDVEIKSNPEEPEVNLDPKTYAESIVAVLRAEGMAGRASILSFDWRTLKHVQSIAPDIPTVCLTAQLRNLDNLKKGQPGPSPWTAGLDIDAFGGSVPKLVAAAGCKVWSVYRKELGRAALEEAQALGLAVHVWTVNETSEMKKLVALGVDGIVTDYPDKLRRLLEELGAPVPLPTPVD